MNVLIVVTHLLGTGHLARALTLARAYVEQGHRVTVASGGLRAPHLPQDGVDFLQLPPLRSDGVNFNVLLDLNGDAIDPTYLQSRRNMLVHQLRADPPDILITELYPFGRRILREEFDALLAAAHALPQRPLICASVRDILAPPSKPAKADRTGAIIAASYDVVLVHSVEHLTPLTASWPVTAALAEKLRYTGYVAPPSAIADPQVPGKDAVIVSAGGGDVGALLFGTAIEAARLTPDLHWHLLVGGGNAASEIARLRADAPANMIITAAHPAFRQMLLHARASVSMCGYNTALDVLQSGVAAVFIPFDAGAEIEQGLRADALATQPTIRVVRNADLTAKSLVSNIQKACSGPARAPMNVGMDGAQETVRITKNMLRDKA